MAIGDKAAAKGLTVFAGTQDRRKGYENDNIRGDDIADVIDAVAGKLDKSAIIVQNATPTGAAFALGTVWVKSAT